jgi:hypothetical protein
MNKNLIAYVFGIAGLAISAGGCVTEAGDDEPTTGIAEANATVCREVEHFDYVHDGSVFHWNVTREIGTGREFVDERRVGGPDVQYRVSPHWSDCPAPNEIVKLTHGSTILIGIHNCLPDGRQEFHGPDYQRLLVPLVPFVTYNCDP